MGVELAKRLLTVEEYYKMAEVGILKPTDKVELINGEIIEKISPVGSKHASIVKRLARMFNEAFQGQAVIGIRDPVRLSASSEPEPDISVLKFRVDDYSDAHPGPEEILAVVEVSSSSLLQDREVKIPLYAIHRVPIYWIIDIENRQIEVFTYPTADIYKNKQVFLPSDRIPLLHATFEVDQILK